MHHITSSADQQKWCPWSRLFRVAMSSSDKAKEKIWEFSTMYSSCTDFGRTTTKTQQKIIQNHSRMYYRYTHWSVDVRKASHAWITPTLINQLGKLSVVNHLDRSEHPISEELVLQTCCVLMILRKLWSPGEAVLHRNQKSIFILYIYLVGGENPQILYNFLDG